MQYVDASLTDLRTEAELVRHARKGDELAFLAIYHRHRSAVFSLLGVSRGRRLRQKA
jgi:hypothetical protein